MENLPLYLPLTFIAITLIAIFILYKATSNNNWVLGIVLAWLALQCVVALTGFYTVTNSVPPRFILLLLPPLLLLIVRFNTLSGQRFIDTIKSQWLTALHTIRIPVELGLFALFIHKAVPHIMTFEGRNFDIFAGLTAPLIWYFGYYKKVLSKTALLIWNFAGIALLGNIIVIAVLSAPFTIQQFGFEQPNVALSYFPYVWLPCFLVPVVLFSHLVSIRQLLRS